MGFQLQQLQKNLQVQNANVVTATENDLTLTSH